MTNPMTKVYAPDSTARVPAWASQETRANRADISRELRDLARSHRQAGVTFTPDKREAVEAMAVALMESSEDWAHHGNVGPSSHDFVYVMSRAVGVGTAHGDVDEALVDAFFEVEQDGATAVELAVWLHARLFGA